MGMKMVLVPAGNFMMGNRYTAEDELKALRCYYSVMTAEFCHDEYPRHQVRITGPFYMGAYPITVGQFKQFVRRAAYKTEAERSGEGAMGFDPSEGVWSSEYRPEWSWRNPGFKQMDDQPVVDVSWNDAVAFCVWLSRLEGKRYRLPTEAEWEYACRGGTTTRFYNGDDPEKLPEIGNVEDADFGGRFRTLAGGNAGVQLRTHDGYVFTAPVGKFRPNAFGLYDMLGNVKQWCGDWYDDEYYRVSPVDDPTGPKHAKRLADQPPSATAGDGFRVWRGSCWGDGPAFARCAARGYDYSHARDNGTGFRIVLLYSAESVR